MAAEGIRAILDQIGLTAESVGRVRLGHGVVGKTTWVMVAAVLVLGVVAYRLRDATYLGLLAILVVLLVLFYLHKVLAFARENPAAALLEGAEFLQLETLKMAAKSDPSPPALPPVEPPKELTSGGSDDR